MTEVSRERLRATFDEAAELYNRARPGYPSQLFDDLAALAQLHPGSRVLEVGSGTGKATVPLAERGYHLVAVELGANMAAVARRHLARFPNVEVVVAPFETWPLPDKPFDAVIFATAFHWIDPAVRLQRAAEALRPGGALATIGTHHVASADDSFFVEVQRCYERWDPATRPGFRLPTVEEIPQVSDDLMESGLFESPIFRRYVWEEVYTTAQYRDLLMTYSGHRAMEPAARQGLLACIADLMEREYGGRITKTYVTELRFAFRKWHRE